MRRWNFTLCLAVVSTTQSNLYAWSSQPSLMLSRYHIVVSLMLVLTSVLSACSDEERLTVRATAFNSTRAQTDSRPTESACGDTLRPGIKAIAVSRDLKKRGLDCGTEVRIEGLKGEYTVMDLTAARHKNLIDIYMGRDVKAARQWGVQEVEIAWED
jgi:3D (Asp-Asp-Asp) domain-containing protein